MVNGSSRVPTEAICDEVWALIPARSGSKGVVDKNMQKIQGFSLIALAVTAASASFEIDECFVSTDSALYAGEARKYGAKAPFLRPLEAASDTATDLDVFSHFIQWAFINLGRIPWAFVHLRPTTPCRESAVIDAAVRLARNQSRSVSAIRSVHSAAESPQKWCLEDDKGYLKTLSGDRLLDAANRGRADFQEVLIPNGYVDVIFSEKVLASNLLHGDSVAPFRTEPTLEIDRPFELEILRKAELISPAIIEAASALSIESTNNEIGEPCDPYKVSDDSDRDPPPGGAPFA